MALQGLKVNDDGGYDAVVADGGLHPLLWYPLINTLGFHLIVSRVLYIDLLITFSRSRVPRRAP